MFCDGFAGLASCWRNHSAPHCARPCFVACVVLLHMRTRWYLVSLAILVVSPVFFTLLHEQVAVLSALSAKRKSGASDSHSAKKRKVY